MRRALTLLPLVALCGCYSMTPATAANAAADAKIAILTADGIAQISCLAIKNPADSARCSAIATETAKILEANADAIERKALTDAAAQAALADAGAP